MSTGQRIDQALEVAAKKKTGWSKTATGKYLQVIDGVAVELVLRRNTTYKVSGRIRTPSGTRNSWSITLYGRLEDGFSTRPVKASAFLGECNSYKDQAFNERYIQFAKKTFGIEIDRYGFAWSL